MQVNDRYSGIRLLLVGCGSIGKRHAQVLTELGITKLTACDPSEEQCRTMRELLPQVETVNDYDAALATGQFDAVFILTPTAMHISMAEKALKAGCHVFIEKPLANSSEGVDQLKALAESVNRKVMVGFCFRYHEVLKMAKDLLEKGTIGRLINIRALMGEPFAEIQQIGRAHV